MTDVMDRLEQTRGLRAELLLDYGLTAVEQDGKEPAVGLPYRRDGKAYAWKYRSLMKRFWSTTGVSRGLWNEEELSGGSHRPAVITEGEIDALSCIQAGFHRAVSVPDGWGES